MADYPMMPLWTDAYLADTSHLNTEEHGAYLLLLIAAWRSPDCKIPDNDAFLAKVSRLGMKRWLRVRSALEPFWTVSDGVWIQKRLSAERKKTELVFLKRRKAALAGVQAKRLKNKETSSAHGEPMEQPPLNPGEPIPTLPYPIASESISNEIDSSDPPSVPHGGQSENVELLPIPLFMRRPPGGDWSVLLFRQGLDWLVENSGQSERQARAMLGKWLKLTGGDHQAVFEKLAEAEQQKIADPAGWVSACLQAPAKASGISEELRRKWAEEDAKNEG